MRAPVTGLTGLHWAHAEANWSRETCCIISKYVPKRCEMCPAAEGVCSTLPRNAELADLADSDVHGRCWGC